jgi:glycosyltransferase involved in cell wall biosynthesis
VLHEQTGLLADVGDTETLASNIKILIENKELQNTLTKNAKQKVLEFSKEQTAQKTLEVYNSVVNRKSQLK